jgi:hypothetical protein
MEMVLNVLSQKEQYIYLKEITTSTFLCKFGEKWIAGVLL